MQIAAQFNNYFLTRIIKNSIAERILITFLWKGKNKSEVTRKNYVL